MRKRYYERGVTKHVPPVTTLSSHSRREAHIKRAILISKMMLDGRNVFNPRPDYTIFPTNPLADQKHDSNVVLGGSQDSLSLSAPTPTLYEL